MKLITAIIHSDKLDIVREALVRAKIERITVSRCAGRGREGEVDLYRGQVVLNPLIPRVRLEIACNDEFKDITVKTIIEAAKEGDGKIGDGKIFVTNLEECYRIRTGESGKEAI